jgi:hypothetical protein
MNVLATIKKGYTAVVDRYETDSTGLLARKGFSDLTPEQKKKICNGMGSQATWWNKLLYWFIPNHFFGLDMALVANRHDYGYTVGGPLWMKIVEDTVFFINMVYWIWRAGKHHRIKRLWLASKYYMAVLLGGKSSFNHREVAP